MKISPRNALTLIAILLILLPSCSGKTTATPTLPAVTATLLSPTQAAATPIPPTPTPTPGPISIGAVSGMPAGSEGFPWWDDSTIYEIFIRSFYDSNGDGKGDINGITEKLDYLNDSNPSTHTDLGVTGIWLLPIFPSPSYHGYDVTDFYNVNPDYGSLDDLKKLLTEAHRRGIRIILDMPFNYTSSQHPWFKQALDPKSPYRNWYVWSDTDPGYMGPWGQQVWYPSPAGNGYYYAVFSNASPDLNYRNPEVMAEMEKVSKFWLKDVGVDGFRIDGARYIVEDGKTMADSPSNHKWFEEMRTYIKSIASEALLLGEVWTTDFAVYAYMKGNELDLAFDFDLASAILQSANSGTAEKVMGQLTFSLKNFPPGTSAPFQANHDMDRTLSQLGGDMEKAKNSAAILLTSQGVPFIYYGEEIGMSGQRGSDNTDIKRRLPMQWSGGENAGFSSIKPWADVYPFYSQTNVAVENGRPDSLLSYYRSLVQLRNEHVGLRVGNTLKLNSSNIAVYAIIRASKEEQVIVLINLSAQPVENLQLSLDEGPLAGSYHVVPLAGEGKFPDLKANAKGGYDSYTPLPSIPPNARLILQLLPIK